MGRKSKINEQELLLLHGAGLTNQEIADKLGVSRSAVTKRLNLMKQESPDSFQVMTTEEYRKKEPAVLAELRRLAADQLLHRLRQGEKIPITGFSTFIGTLIDKERLLEDKSTSNVLHAHVIENMSDDERKLLAGDSEDEAIALLQLASAERARKKDIAESSESGDSEEGE